jgi:hypothetical protein
MAELARKNDPRRGGGDTDPARSTADPADITRGHPAAIEQIAPFRRTPLDMTALGVILVRMVSTFVDLLAEGAPVSLVDLALLPLRVARRIAGGDAKEVRGEAPPESDLIVENGMPEGVPPAALRPEPRLPTPAGWPFGEDFPRTCGTGRLSAGALFWTDFVYDDHGAAGTRVKLPGGRVVPPKGTYIYPDPPPATGPTSSGWPSGLPNPTPGGGSTGTRW